MSTREQERQPVSINKKLTICRMKVIFERESEIGRCDDALVKDPEFAGSGSEPWTIYAHTAASLTGSKRMLKVEQRCYLRRGDDIPEQSWVKPEILLEPVLGTEEETVAIAQEIHERFIAKALQEFPEDSLVAI
jgi:hypothetical protein